MPGGDASGPAGMGPMTGWGPGWCAGNPAPGYGIPAFGRAPWFCRRPGRGGGGQGWRNWFYATGLPGWARSDKPLGWGFVPPTVTPTAEQEANLLKLQIENLTAALESAKQRIQEIETTPSE